MRIIAVLLVLGIAAATPGKTKPTGPPAKADAHSDVKGGSSATAGAADADESIQGKRRARPARNVLELLESRVPEVQFEAVPLGQVMEWVSDYVAERSDALVYVRWAVLAQYGITPDAPVTAKARNKKLSQILWVIMNEAKGASDVTLAYEASIDLFLFSTHEDLSRRMITRVYDVADLVHEVPDFGLSGGFNKPLREFERLPQTHVRRQLPPPGPTSGGDALPAAPPPREITVTGDPMVGQLMELILNTVEPESWEMNGFGGRGTIFPHINPPRKLLIIRNSLHVHQLVERGLKPKRQPR